MRELGHQNGDLGLSMTSRYAGREAMETKARRGTALVLLVGLIRQGKR